MQELEHAIAAQPAEAREAEKPVAWMWQWIGHSFRTDTLVARTLTEMDPASPPFPKAWKPLYPLYAAPQGVPREPTEEMRAAAQKWVDRGDLYSIGQALGVWEDMHDAATGNRD